MAGSVAIAPGAEFIWRGASELYFDSPNSSTIYGLDAESGAKFTMAGTSSASRDSKVTGHTTNGCYVVITGNTWSAGNITINNATIDYVSRKGTAVNGVTIQYVNCRNEAECAIDGLDVTNIMNTYGLTFVGGTVINMKNIRAGSVTNNKTGVSLSGCVVKGENTISGKSSSGYGIRLLYCMVNGIGSVFSGEATSGRGISAESCMVDSWAASGVCTGGQAVVLQGCSVRGGTTTAAAGAGYGIHWGGSVVLGGIHAATANPTSGYAHLFSQTEIAGGTITATQAKYGFYWYFSIVSHHVGGRLIASGCANAVYPHANALFDTTLRKDGFKDVWLFGNTSDIANSPTWREPVIYHNHSSDKTAMIYFECSPFNLSDFITSGVTRNGTNLDITAGGYIVSPEVRPWDVSQWSSASYAKTGGAATVYIRASTDGGASWSDWIERVSGADLTAVPTGLNGNDIIQWKLENASGTCTLSNLTITFSYARETLPEHTEEWQGDVRIPTYAKSGAHHTLARLMKPDSTSVTVSLIGDDGTPEPLTCAEASSAGGSLWRWSTAGIATQPATATHYVATFSDQNANKVFFDLYMGGAEDIVIGTDRNVKTII